MRRMKRFVLFTRKRPPSTTNKVIAERLAQLFLKKLERR
jgi:hypothetical protein